MASMSGRTHAATVLDRQDAQRREPVEQAVPDERRNGVEDATALRVRDVDEGGLPGERQVLTVRLPSHWL